MGTVRRKREVPRVQTARFWGSTYVKRWPGAVEEGEDDHWPQEDVEGNRRLVKSRWAQKPGLRGWPKGGESARVCVRARVRGSLASRQTLRRKSLTVATKLVRSSGTASWLAGWHAKLVGGFLMPWAGALEIYRGGRDARCQILVPRRQWRWGFSLEISTNWSFSQELHLGQASSSKAKALAGLLTRQMKSPIEDWPARYGSPLPCGGQNDAAFRRDEWGIFEEMDVSEVRAAGAAKALGRRCINARQMGILGAGTFGCQWVVMFLGWRLTVLAFTTLVRGKWNVEAATTVGECPQFFFVTPGDARAMRGDPFRASLSRKRSLVCQIFRETPVLGVDENVGSSRDAAPRT
ncbi:hypothetical protein LX32DRAFT_176133 [Colletotrichum zoysiae]|uniref:Uncharacterized protein n=1 Tax=Colletotrichum zoysiae TaxID=1216348 RepID=A0AAD9H5K6_9PEZI|nr:hypothetical protein LX32DRAFT_176133 [Colletotrichum zoysiae]